jgi:hypothetical protein
VADFIDRALEFVFRNAKMLRPIFDLSSSIAILLRSGLVFLVRLSAMRAPCAAIVTLTSTSSVELANPLFNLCPTIPGCGNEVASAILFARWPVGENAAASAKFPSPPLDGCWSKHTYYFMLSVHKMELLLCRRLVKSRSARSTKKWRLTCQSFFGCWVYPSS